jgi:class 3 adenylate cyclase/CheY-like chemotaxis protein
MADYLSNLRILVVDDSREIRDFVIEYALLPHGYKPIVACDGAEGLNKALTQEPDLILLDFEMPKMSGLEVLEALQKHSFEVPVILMTSYGSEEVAVQVFRLGVRDYIIKPFTVPDLLQSMQRVMSEVALRREKAALTQQLLQTNRRLEKHVAELKALYEIGKSVTALMPLDSLLGRITDAALYITRADRCVLMLNDLETGQLRERVSKQRARPDDPAPPSEDTAARLEAPPSRFYVPLRVGDKEIGVLGISNQFPHRTFSDHDRQMLGTLADYAAIAIENVRLLAHVEQTKEQEKQEIQGLFERYVAASVVKELLNGSDLVKLGGSRHLVSVLFADLRDFTQFIARTTPEALIDVLNRHITAAADAVLAQEGTLDKFVGDAVMAFFNAPLPQPDHALRAVRAAMAIHRALRRLHDDLPPELRLQFGIGISVGEAVVGNIGTPSLMNFTVVGETVVLGQRLQARAKGGQTLICQQTYDLVREHVHARPLGTVELKGLSTRPAFELLDLKT